MQLEPWTWQSAQQWRSFTPAFWPTVLVVAFWLAIRVAVDVAAPYGRCPQEFVCVPEPGFGWWVLLCLASVALLKVLPLIAFACAAAFAAVDVFWVYWIDSPETPRVIAVVAYAMAAGAHFLYLRVAYRRQSEYAAARADTEVRPLERQNSAQVTDWGGVGLASGVVCLALLIVSAAFVLASPHPGPLGPTAINALWSGHARAVVMLPSGPCGDATVCGPATHPEGPRWLLLSEPVVKLYALETFHHYQLNESVPIDFDPTADGRGGMFRLSAPDPDLKANQIAAWIPVVLGGAAVAGLLAWSIGRRDASARDSLTSDSHLGIPVEAIVGLPGHLWLTTEGRPFATFRADTDSPGGRDVWIGDRLSGTLYGDLRVDGWAAVATGDAVILPSSRLSKDVGGTDPTRVHDRVAPDFVAVAEATTKTSTTRYEIHPSHIVRTLQNGPRRSIESDTITIDSITWVGFQELEGMGGAWLHIVSPDFTFILPEWATEKLAPALGQRLIENQRGKVVDDDHTRIYLEMPPRGRT